MTTVRSQSSHVSAAGRRPASAPSLARRAREARALRVVADRPVPYALTAAAVELDAPDELVALTEAGELAAAELEQLGAAIAGFRARVSPLASEPDELDQGDARDGAR